EKSILLHAAREAIRSLYDNEVKNSVVDFNYYPELKKKDAGAFVTLTKNGKLRGCVGYITSIKPLFDTVIDAAQNSAVNDPRFSPVREEELSHIDIEVSILSPPESFSGYDSIIIGKHGLLLDEEHYRSVLLPQVAIEHNFTVSDFLSALCEKAGLERNAWVNEILDIKVFTAEIISELGKRIKTYEKA
ncbi:MAG: AmmeMemoRadiSam system protein A, partial [Ignavibacteriaceae bacterium]